MNRSINGASAPASIPDGVRAPQSPRGGSTQNQRADGNTAEDAEKEIREWMLRGMKMTGATYTETQARINLLLSSLRPESSREWPSEVGILYTEEGVYVDTGVRADSGGNVALPVKKEQADAIRKALKLAHASEAEARRVLQIMAELTITENGQYIPTAAAVMKQMAKDALDATRRPA